MQYNTFRQTQHIPMATTFCTNHLRQVGVAASQALRHRDKNSVQRMLAHCRMLFAFVAGGTTAAVLCRYLPGKALLFTLLPLGYLFVDLPSGGYSFRKRPPVPQTGRTLKTDLFCKGDMDFTQPQMEFIYKAGRFLEKQTPKDGFVFLA